MRRVRIGIHSLVLIGLLALAVMDSTLLFLAVGVAVIVFSVVRLRWRQPSSFRSP